MNRQRGGERDKEEACKKISVKREQLEGKKKERKVVRKERGGKSVSTIGKGMRNGGGKMSRRIRRTQQNIVQQEHPTPFPL